MTMLVEFVVCLSTDAVLIAKYLETIVLQVRSVSHSLLGSRLTYCLSLGAVHSRVPHALHFEVVAVTQFEAPVPHVSSRMAVQRNVANSSRYFYLCTIFSWSVVVDLLQASLFVGSSWWSCSFRAMYYSFQICHTRH